MGNVVESFGFDDLIGVAAESPQPTSDTPPWEDQAEPLKQWAGEVVDQAIARAGGGVAGGNATAIVWDVETGPRSEEELRAIFREKTLDEFAADCDKRWKPETVAAKYEAYKVDAWDEFVRRAALSPLTGRVLLIGVTDQAGPPQFIFGDESDMLSIFWGRVEEWLANKIPPIGHNSNSFDLPFLVRRSWALGVPVPREVRQGRYWNPLFRDTMEWWACGARDTIKLNTLGEFFGVG